MPLHMPLRYVSCYTAALIQTHFLENLDCNDYLCNNMTNQIEVLIGNA